MRSDVMLHSAQREQWQVETSVASDSGLWGAHLHTVRARHLVLALAALGLTALTLAGCASQGQPLPDVSTLDAGSVEEGGQIATEPAAEPAAAAAEVTWKEGCAVPAEGDEGSGQKRTPTAYSNVTTRAPSMEPYVVCAWEQTDLATGDHLAFIAQIDTSTMGQAIGPLYSDGWVVCEYEGSSAFLYHPDDPSTLVQLAESGTTANLSDSDLRLDVSTCTAGD
ncbi:hypothetical protein AB1K54_07205 [Microbacterium sp. BWT-B31]|uniref:hypothetical protein n=1 Tax=Microbacterium sp. BWT-B31 TaxID=3232072 RepID=UPI0035293D88